MTLPRSIRSTAGNLLLAESRTRRAIQQATDGRIDHAVAEMAKREQDQDERRKRVAALALIATLAHSMGSLVRDTIVPVRQQVRALASERMRIELAAAGITLAALGHPSTGYAVDMAHADIAGAGLAQAWRSAAVAKIAEAERTGKALAAAIEDTRPYLAPRIKRTAVTETVHAFNDERRAIVLDPATARALEESRVFRQWVAVLDRRTCSVCAGLDGETTTVGGLFPGGYEPGSHPNCRCFDTLIRDAQPLAA